MPAARVVDFGIHKEERLLLSGHFTATSAQETTSFGPRFRWLAGPNVHSATVTHEMRPDGSVSFELTLYAGRSQVVRAGVSMGSESGEDGADSVMLGPDHTLVFQTHKA